MNSPTDSAPQGSRASDVGQRLPSWLRPVMDPLTHWKRAVAPQWGASVATAEEKALLTSTRAGKPLITGAHAQDYLAWRRSSLAVAGLALTVTTAIGLIEWLVGLASKNDFDGMFDTGTENFLALLLVLATGVLAFSALRALEAWETLPTSHRRLRLGWIVGFLLPFGVAMVPVSSLLHLDAATGAQNGVAEADRAQAQEVLGQIVGTLGGIVFFLKLVPSVMSVLVGTIRAGLGVKRFAPEAAAPGWVAAGAAPVFLLLLMTVIVVLNQLGGSLLLVLSFALIAAGYLTLTFRAGALAGPASLQEVEARVAPVLKRYRMFVVSGTILLFIALCTIKLFGRPMIGFSEGSLFKPWEVIRMLIELAGKSLFVALLFSDLLVALLRHAWTASHASTFTTLGQSLEAKFTQLDEAGLQEFRGPVKPPTTTSSAP